MTFDPNEDNKSLWRCWGCAVNNRSMFCTLGSALGVCGVIIMIALLALSIHDIDENEMAIEYHKVARGLGGVLDAGKHVLSPDSKLFIYDRKFVTNDLKVDCITKDGLFIDLKVTQQYQLEKEDLKKILFEFGEQEDLDEYIDTIAQDTIRDTCAHFTGEQYFSSRGDVEQTMIDNITLAMETADTHVRPGFVQLRNIALPQELLDAIKDKQIALEEVDVATNEREQQLIQKETEKQEAELDAQILLVAAQAIADGVIIDANEKADARLIQWDERTKAFLIDMEALGISPEIYVDDYLFPRLRASTLTPEQQTCLQTCPEGTACWFCFATASPAVIA